MVDLFTVILLAASALFFTGGTIGLVRLPDVHCRLHALTKADNVGLGLLIAALMIRADSAADLFKLAAIWLLVIAAGAATCFLLAQSARRPSERRGP